MSNAIHASLQAGAPLPWVCMQVLSFQNSGRQILSVARALQVRENVSARSWFPIQDVNDTHSFVRHLSWATYVGMQ